jgi:hypothetical protein
VDEANVQKASEVNASVSVGVPSGGELVLYDVAPGEKISIEAVPSLIYSIDRIDLNPAKVPYSRYASGAVNRFPAGTYPQDGDDAIDLTEWTEKIEKYADPGKLRFSPEFYLYLTGHDALLSGAKIKVDAVYTDRDSSEDTLTHLIKNPDPGGYGILDTGGVPPSGENAYSGPLSQSLVAFDADTIVSLFTAEQPRDLRIAYNFALPNGRRSVNFDDEEENTVKAKADLVAEIPLSLTILADDGGDYATLRYYDVLSKGDTADAFDRARPGVPLAEGLKKLNSVYIELNYENAIGLDGLELDLVSRVSGSENFRRSLGVLAEGTGSLAAAFSGDELPFPFIPGFELRIPALYNGAEGKYAVLEITRGGGIRLDPRISVRAELEQEFSF